MKKKVKKVKKDEMANCCSGSSYSSCNDMGYVLGFIGAVIYYISTATGFWVGVLGVLKAIVWPLFLVLEVLKYIGA